MKTRNLLTIAISAFVALNFTSCKENEDDEPFHFPADQVELLLPDGVVVDTTIRKKDIVSSTNPNYTVVVMVGTEKDNLSTFMGNDKCVLKIDQKYYWQAKVVDSKSGENSEFSEIRSFYVLDPKMKVTMDTDNGETENAIVLRWSGIDHNKYKNIKLQMKPTKECGFAGKTFDIPDGQDSLYIRLADNPEIPYMFNDFDDLHGVNYEPVVYEFSFVSEVVVGDKEFQTYSGSVKEIFLNKKNHIRDHEYNVYRVVEVGDQIWMADDLRCTSYIDTKGDTIQMKLNVDYVVSELPSGAKGILYNHNFLFNEDDAHLNGIVPPKYHYAADADWNKLEKVYGIDAEDSKLSGIVVIDKSGGHITYLEDAAYPISKQQYEYENISDEDYNRILCMTDSLYVDSPYINLWEKFASVSDWVDEIGNFVYPSKSVFNIKPFGYARFDENKSVVLHTQGYGALYYSRPKRVRTFFSLKSGIGHYQLSDDYYNEGNVSYSVRLVKDIK